MLQKIECGGLGKLEHGGIRMNKLLGQRLRELREELGYTQKDLAKIIGQTVQSVYFLETGKRSITYPVAYVLAHEMQINIEYLLDDNAIRKNVTWNYSQGFDDGYKKALKDMKKFIMEVLE